MSKATTGRRKKRDERRKRNWHFHSQEWSISNFPCSLTRNITSHSLELTQMKDYYTTNSHYLTYTLLFRKVGRMYFLNLGVKRLRKGKVYEPRALCTVSLRYSSACLVWLKTFLYTVLPPNKNTSLSSVMEPSVRPVMSSAAHCASASMGLST